MYIISAARNSSSYYRIPAFYSNLPRQKYVTCSHFPVVIPTLPPLVGLANWSETLQRSDTVLPTCQFRSSNEYFPGFHESHYKLPMRFNNGQSD